MVVFKGRIIVIFCDLVCLVRTLVRVFRIAVVTTLCRFLDWTRLQATLGGMRMAVERVTTIDGGKQDKERMLLLQRERSCPM